MITTAPRSAKVRHSFSRLAWVLCAAIAMIFVTLWAPGPLVDRMLRADLLHDAQIYGARMIAQLDQGADTFTSGAFTSTDTAFLASIPKTSTIHLVNLYDLAGRIIFSTTPALIGTLHEGTHAQLNGLETEPTYTINEVSGTQISDHHLQSTAHDDGQVHHVAEIDIPISAGGVFVGVIELNSEITYIRQVFIFRTQMIMGAVATLALAVMGSLLILSQRGNSRQMLAIRDQARKERAMMDDQVQLAREVRLLGELNEWLQSSRSLEELFDMVARFMTHMLPACEGSVYVYSNSRDVLDGCSSWNGATHKAHIHPEECWGLRRGRTYAFGESEIDFTCAHSEPHDGRPYICFPILAHGETVGLMHLRARSDSAKADFMAARKLAQMSAEQISMAIANVRMRDQLQDQSIRDPLTGLYNRRHLTESLRRFLQKSQKSGTPCAVVSIDVDHFKKFNDNHGHDAGDMVLRAVGEVLHQQCDGDEVACRMGGEEFMLLLPDCSATDAVQQGEIVRLAVENVTVRYGDKTLPRVTISVGVAACPDHGLMPQDVMRAADDALYDAKALGRNQVVLARGHGDTKLRRDGASLDSATIAALSSAAIGTAGPSAHPPQSLPAETGPVPVAPQIAAA